MVKFFTNGFFHFVFHPVNHNATLNRYSPRGFSCTTFHAHALFNLIDVFGQTPPSNKCLLTDAPPPPR